ncbi:ABC transporter ATP-binding protein/permease [Cuneatibacter sp. NSJ-177]|uniref:ABC transporter ATP-binding protein n=1 Tax=Cuneatibacter sp. NSJ-177 TaxID=2931401 RepID=UPI001FD2E80A|nr:ABC transporter ATP-binding protein [Cuneatibacter sp. NSJ-177]MCJ7836952.1 ABC transporter ATP-binding protein/permease [Cuneatibacter sp. NSJ-177]
MFYLKRFLVQHKGKVALAVFLLLGQVAGTLLIPALVANIVDLGILHGDMAVILRTGGQMLAVTILAAGISAWGSWVTSDLSALFGREMRSLLLNKSQELSIQQFDEVGISSMITRATSDITNLQRTMGMVFQLVVPAPIIVAVSIAMTTMVSPVMSVIQLVFMAVLLGIAAVILKKSNALSRSIQTRLDRINQVVREAVTGVRVIRAFGNETYEEERSGAAFADYAGNMIRLNRLFAVVNPVVWLLMGALMAVILGVGGGLVLGGSMAVGQITAVTEYSTLTMAYLIMAASVMTTLPKAGACLERLREMLDTEPAVSDAKGFPTEEASETAAAIEFDHVTFAYQGAEEPVIRDLSFSMAPGQTTAVIGSTGSGKSTLADLLLRLHDTQTGRIRLKGVDVRILSQQDLRERIGCVPQKAFLFSGTIAENLRMGRKDAADEELWEALRIAQAEDFVKQLPSGLNAPVAQGGTNFSGGQRQRLSIARALVKKADIFIFDDSFSALDVRTDTALRRALHESVTEPAKLIIAQRVSTILDADQILVLDKGRLVGAGTHQELLERCPVYRDIADSQMQRKEA